MIRVNDLEVVAKGIQPPGDKSRLAQRKELARPAGVLAEIHDGNRISGLIHATNSERRARRAASAIFMGGEHHRNHPPGLCLSQATHPLPLDPRDG
jgi:hypothetical protein